jgi:hypothetical protein
LWIDSAINEKDSCCRSYIITILFGCNKNQRNKILYENASGIIDAGPEHEENFAENYMPVISAKMWNLMMQRIS